MGQDCIITPSTPKMGNVGVFLLSPEYFVHKAIATSMYRVVRRLEGDDKVAVSVLSSFHLVAELLLEKTV